MADFNDVRDQHNRSLRAFIKGGAVALALIASASGAFLTGAGTALAPEPARVTQPLAGSTGASATAYYTTSHLQVRVLKWPGSYTYGSNPPAAGTPCSTTPVAEP